MVADLSVVIVNWRNEEQTLRCISTLRGWHTLSPELFVVDNGSTEASQKRLSIALRPTELICSEANLGYAGGNNLGIACAMRGRSRFVLLLNSDATIAEEDVIRLLERLEGNLGIAILGPVLNEWQKDGVQSHVGGRDILRNSLTRQSVEPGALHKLAGYPLCDVDYVPGTALIIRRTLFEEIGLLDEEFFFSGELADFCKRARAKGHRVCVDLEAEAKHDAGAYPNPLRATLYVYYSLRNRLLYAKKHHRRERTKYFALWSKLCLVELGKALAQARLRKARAILLAMAHGITNQFGNQNAAFL